MEYTIYYRNFLKYCNYTCSYCPFSKGNLDAISLKKEKKYLYKFIDYIKNSRHSFRLFFAPKGELLIHDMYKEAFTALSKMKNVIEIVVQTNLSSSLDWLDFVDRDKLILWSTYHPRQVKLDLFLNQVDKLILKNMKFTIGTVGVKENFYQIENMSKKLKTFGKSRPYFWINAYKDEKNYYDDRDIEFLETIDPLFRLNLQDYVSKDQYCRTGESAFFVEFNGSIHRCWKDKVKIGNLYNSDLSILSNRSKCKNKHCTCFIGYNNIESLELDEKYQTSLIGRMV